MKIGIIVKPNEKGQFVIPKEIRKNLGITHQTPLQVIVRGGGFYVYPVKGIISESTKQENPYLKTLLATRGAWIGDPTMPADKKRTIELQASALRKKQW